MARTHIGTTLISPLDGTLAAGGNKITGLANGTAATDAMAFGQNHMFQVQAATSTTFFSSTSTTFVLTNLAKAITPTSASSNILIHISNSIFNTTTGSGATVYVSIARNGTNLGGTNGFTVFQPTVANAVIPVSIVYLDSPATTSAVTYAMTVRVASGTVFVGEDQGSNVITQSIVLTEVQ